MCEGFCVGELCPSPKSHEYVSVSPSASVPVAVNATEVFRGTSPDGVREVVTVGAWLAASATMTVPFMVG